MKKILLLIMTLLNAVSYSDWVSTASGTSNDLMDVLFVNQNTGYACGDNGTIIKTTNGGINWVNQITGTSDFLTSLAMNPSNSSVIYAAGNNGVILKTINGGTNWSMQNIGGLYDDVVFKDINTGITAGFGGFMYRTTNAGNNWVNVDPGIGLTTIYSLCIGGGNIYGGCESGKIIKSTNNGLNWTNYQTPGSFGFYGLYFSDANTGYAVDNTGKVFMTSNGGVNWNQISVHTGTKYAITTNGTDMFMCGVQGKILKSTNNGVNWIVQNTSATVSFSGLQFVNTTTGFAVGENGSVYKTTNGGEPIGINIISNEIPEKYTLSQNYPNPFNPTTNIEFSIPKNEFVSLKIYDEIGREIAVLVNENLKAGTYKIDFNASGLNSGLFFYKIQTATYTETRKMILVK